MTDYIDNSRQLSRFHKGCLRKGFIHLQYTTFYCRIDFQTATPGHFYPSN